MGENAIKSERKGLSAWQLTMMALGSVIGGSFFLGSSVVINAAGPAVIMATHIGYRRREGCPPGGICQMPGFPLTSWIALGSLIIVLLCMPFIPGQTAGLVTGSSMVVVFSLIYYVMYYRKRTNAKDSPRKGLSPRDFQPGFATELSEELVETVDESIQEK